MSESSKNAPRFSLIIPARNEQLELPRCLAAIKLALSCYQQKYNFEHEIIVVLNRCTDKTQAIAEEFGCRCVIDDSKNLARIRNAGAQAAKGVMLIFIDADSRMHQKTLSKIESILSNGASVGGGVIILPERWSLGILLTMLCLVPIALFYRISAGLFFCLKNDFNQIAGFNEQLASVEDIDFARRLRAHGKITGRRFVTLFSTPIVTSCRKFDRFGDWYFILRPLQLLKLLKGRDQKAADKIWYDFER